MRRPPRAHARCRSSQKSGTRSTLPPRRNRAPSPRAPARASAIAMRWSPWLSAWPRASVARPPRIASRPVARAVARRARELRRHDGQAVGLLGAQLGGVAARASRPRRTGRSNATSGISSIASGTRSPPTVVPSQRLGPRDQVGHRLAATSRSFSSSTLAPMRCRMSAARCGSGSARRRARRCAASGCSTPSTSQKAADEKSPGTCTSTRAARPRPVHAHRRVPSTRRSAPMAREQPLGVVARRRWLDRRVVVAVARTARPAAAPT